MATWNDDGLPQPAALAWVQFTGPSPIAFSATNVAAPFATAPSAGTYDLRFTVTDGAQQTSQDVRLAQGFIANRAED